MTNFETTIRSMGFSRVNFKNTIFDDTVLFEDDKFEGIVAVRNNEGSADAFFWVNSTRFARFFCSNISIKNYSDYKLTIALFRKMTRVLENKMFNGNTSEFKSAIEWYRSFLGSVKEYAQKGDVFSLKAMCA